MRAFQAYKSTGNAKEGVAFFNHWSQVSEEHLRWRDIVVERRKARDLYVQTKLVKDENDEGERKFKYF